jgi:Contact-dependent growth inhibition CdiA C-terminal domain
LPRTAAENIDRAPAPHSEPADAALRGESTTETDSRKDTGAWNLVATPRHLRFAETEVGAVSSPRTITLINQGAEPIDIASLELVFRDGAGEPAHPGEFELVQGTAGRLLPWRTMTIEVVFRPSRAVSHIAAHLRAKGHGSHDVADVIIKASSVAARPEHADQRELSVAQHTARKLVTTGTLGVEHYGDMLAAVLAAQDLTDRTKPGDTAASAQIIKLLEPVERRLSQLNDHQGRLAQFGAGNIAGQATLDMSETAVRSWRQRLALGTIVRAEELVTRFRAGAETIRFLTGEHADAPTLREFDHVSRVVGVGAAAPVLAPPLAALAIEGAALLAFAPRVAASRVALWALHHPAAALAASEALLGFGVQIGEDGWGSLWGQLQDPQGRWFVIAQVLMDFMHVKSSMSGHDGSPRNPRPTATGVEPAPDLDGARQRVAKARAILQQVHDAAVETPGGEAVKRDGPATAASPSASASAPQSAAPRSERPRPAEALTHEPQSGPTKLTGPSGLPEPYATPTGKRTSPDPADKDPINIRALAQENESADVLAKNGYHVEQNPRTAGRKNPDYRIEGDTFDNYAPTTSNTRAIWSVVQEKVVAGQARRIVLNLSSSRVDVVKLKAQFYQWPIEHLEQIIVIQGTSVTLFWP